MSGRKQTCKDTEKEHLDKHVGNGVGWFARAAIAKYHRLGGLNNRNLLLTVLEAGSLKSGYWQVWFLRRPLFLACRWPPSCCEFTWLFLCVFTAASLVSLPLLIRTLVTLGQGPTVKYSHVG